jgi:hypothetical protein
MTITIELDKKQKEVYQNVTDAFLAVRQLNSARNDKGKMATIIDTSSRSWGPNVRDIIKEITQSTIELQDYLKELKDGTGR